MRGWLAWLWLLCWLGGGAEVGGMGAGLRNGTCPESVLSVEGCVCEVWVSGLKLVCTAADFGELTRALSKADLPVSSLRLRESQGLDGKLPKDAFGRLLLRELDLTSNGLDSMSPDALGGQREHLRLLLLANNSLTTLPNLRGFQRMEVLDATGNKINLVTEATMPPALTQLRLKRNAICVLPANAFGASKRSLVILDLADNCLRTVPSLALRGAPKLGYLDLSGNQITGDLGFHAFADMPQLRELRLARNPLRGFGLQTFHALPALQHLSIRSSSLASLPRGVLSPTATPALSILDLTGSRLEKLGQGALEGLGELRQVLLDGNRIERVETGAVADLRNLQLLSIQNNSLVTLESGAMRDLPSLLILLLSDNGLESLQADALGELPGLQQLSLARNKLASLSPAAFQGLPKLTTVDLSRNALDELAVGVLEPLRELAFMDLRHNSIRSFANGSLPRRVPSLLLSDNPLHCERASVTYFLTYLAKNNVRTSLPDQKALVCASPPALKGLDMKALVAQRANETFFQGIDSLLPGGFTPGGTGAQLPLANLLPSLEKIPGIQPVGIPGLNAPIPGLNSVARAIPGFKDLPGVNALVNPAIVSPGEPEGLIDSLSGITRPLSRLVTGEKATANDVQELISSLPKLASNLPSVTSIDVSKASPEVIRAFLTGTDIPGIPIPQAARTQITRRVMSQMARAASAANRGLSALPDGTPVSQLLPAPSSLPAETVKSVLQGRPLPTLNAQQTKDIRAYYTQRILHDNVPDRLPEPSVRSTESGPSGEESAQSRAVEEAARRDRASRLGNAPRASEEVESLPVTELLEVLSAGDLQLVPDSVIADIAAKRPLDVAALPEALVSRVRSKDPALADRIDRIVQRQAAANLEDSTTKDSSARGLSSESSSKVPSTEDPSSQPDVKVEVKPSSGPRPFAPSETRRAGAAPRRMNIDDVRVELVDPEGGDDDSALLLSLVGVAVVALATGLAVAALCWRKAKEEKKKSALLFRHAGAGSLDEFLPPGSENNDPSPTGSSTPLPPGQDGLPAFPFPPIGHPSHGQPFPSTPLYEPYSHPQPDESWREEIDSYRGARSAYLSPHSRVGRLSHASFRH